MKDEKLTLQLRRRTSESDDEFFHDSEPGSLVLFVDLGTLNATDAIDVIVAEPFVVVPRVSEVSYVPAPEEIQ
jgi:hypothetical protein